MAEQFFFSRQDLTISCQETEDGKIYIVKIPESGRFFRFGEIEYFIIKQLDGKNSLTTICNNVSEKYGDTLDQETLEGFITSLRQRGLLDDGTSVTGHKTHQQRRIKGTLLYLRFSAFDPDQLLDYLAVKLRFIYTPYFVVFSAALVLLSWLVLLTHADEIQRDIASHLNLGSLFTLWLVVLITVTAHEFAHGLTCKYFGGEVHEIGFLLIFFMPAFFCNVSDAWLFPQKSRRIWVTFAGAYCELFLWALAVLIWRVTAPETSFNFIALTMIGTSGIRILFNFNPLIKLDGYYMLSDYLDIPNLRTRASGYLRFKIKQLFTSNTQITDQARPREQRIYIIYGLSAGIFSILLLVYLASILGGFLIDSFKGPGFILFMGVLMLVFKNQIIKLVNKIRSLTQENKLPIKFSTKKLTYFVSGLIVLFVVELNLTVSGEFQVFPVHNADIRSRLDSIIEEIYVSEGQWVKKGDPVARLSDRNPRSELWKVEAKIKEQNANLKLLLAGPTSEDIALAQGKVEQAKVRYQHALLRTNEAEKMHGNQIAMLKVDVEKAKAQLEFAKKKRDRYHVLAKKKLVPDIKLEEVNEETTVRQKELNEARAEWKMALADVNAETRKELAASESAIKQAQDELNLLLAGSRVEEVEAIQAIIAGLEGEQKHLQSLLDLVVIASPISGVVTTPKPGEKVGQRIEKGELIMEVYDTHIVKVETLIPEKEIGDVKVGQQVALKARAYPNEDFYGTVIAIAPVAMAENNGLGQKVVRVITDIDNSSLLLKPEMTGQTKIYAGKRTIFDLLTRRLIRYLRVEFWSWW